MARKKTSNKNLVDVKKKKRDAEMERRNKIKNDPVRYEEFKRKERERYNKRKEEGKIKLISDLSERGKRQQRKKWVERTTKHRKRQKADSELNRISVCGTPSLSGTEAREVTVSAAGPSTGILERAGSSRKNAGRKRILRNRSKAHQKIKELEGKLKRLSKSAAKYKAKFYRLRKQKGNNESPRTRVREFLNGEKVSTKVVKRLQFGEALTTQIAYNYNANKDSKARQVFARVLSGKIIKKYRLLSHTKEFLSHKRHKKNEGKKIKSVFVKRKYDTKISLHLKNDVIGFFEKDEVSRIEPGKKDVITRNKIKKQRRILNDSLRVLHKQFNESHSYNIAYSTFCFLRPFWVLSPNIHKRDTCLCTKHENFDMIFERLKHLNIIEYKRPDDLIKVLICNEKPSSEQCVERKCDDCKDNQVVAKEFEDKETTYQRWSRKKEKICVKGKEIQYVKVLKETVSTNMKQLFNLLVDALPSYMGHISNINHQYKAIADLKQNLKCTDVLIHIDFAENYVCKYGKEIQSMHFGGSHQQVTLHTCVFYYRGNDSYDLKVLPVCTLSNSLRHDPSSICAYLKPVLKHISSFVRPILNIHFISDSPSTQYRNKKMFFFMTRYLKQFTQETLTWNYSESGHGKGAPDGVGATLKRTADQLVAEGKDLDCYETLIEQLKENSNIKIFTVTPDDITEFDEMLPNQISGFKGTMMTHQVSWSRKQSQVLHLRRLSCFHCLPNEKCAHYHIGDYCPGKAAPSIENVVYSKPLPDRNRKLCYSDIYTDSSDTSEAGDTPVLTLPAVPTNDKLRLHSYVIVEFQGKRSIHSYIGLVTYVDDAQDGEYTVKFLRLVKNNTFVFPVKDDIAVVDFNNIKGILAEPKLSRRDTYIFLNNLSGVKNLC